jgi:hypothetical protein
MRAVAVPVDDTGNPTGEAITVATPVWPGGIAMTAVPDARLAAWEMVTKFPSGAANEVIFGVLVRGQMPMSGMHLGLAVNRAPFDLSALAHIASPNLSVPRFWPGQRQLQIGLE